MGDNIALKVEKPVFKGIIDGRNSEMYFKKNIR
jgi:hypothetical protein